MCAETIRQIVFMGTPAFAVPVLQALHEAGPARGWQVIAAATQPDRPAGRGKQLVASPVKEYALEQGIPVLQPASLRKDPEAVAALAALAPDVIVVAAYGLILPRAVLEIPAFGCLNVHASLLPAYRGASPITAALLDGREETGVTIMLMDEGMDTGPALRLAKTAIERDETAATLSARLAGIGAALLVETLAAWLAGAVAPIPQAELPGEPSICRLIKKGDGEIDWSRPAILIERMTRAYLPWPTAFTTWRGEPFKILEATVVAGDAPAGHVLVTSDGPAVGTGEGLLLLHTVQPAGKRPMDARSFLNGAPAFAGSTLPG